MEIRNTLSGVQVSDAMRRQVIRLSRDKTIAHGVTALIKYKISALLCTETDGTPAGVVSKTDVMGAYYAGLPIDTPLDAIMSAPPLFCAPEESLETALETMRAKGIYRLYVTGLQADRILGALAYPDIVGLLYRYCHGCEYSHLGQKAGKRPQGTIRRFRLKDVMTPEVKAVTRSETLSCVMELLSAYRFGAMLITESDQTPCGVISKTDLVLAYRHRVDTQAPAETIMTSPINSCGENELLEDAIQSMIFADVHRLFVHRATPTQIVGVMSLTDAARSSSGSCHACVSSRIKVD